uniref:hypothetical protein n=1 Tax=Enterococcus faecium TaxID=1352 RepID=UPI0037C17EA5
EDDLKKKGVTVVTNAMAKEAVDNGDSVTVKYAVDGKEESVTAAFGLSERKLDTFRSPAENVAK